MTAVIVCCIISIVNILLWLFFFGQYKRRFSPGKILSDIRSEVNKLLVEINREADRSITLIDARRKGLQKLLDEAKRYTNIASGELDKRNRSQDLQSALTRQSSEIRNSTGNSSLYSFPYSFLPNSSFGNRNCFHTLPQRPRQQNVSCTFFFSLKRML